MHKKFCLSLIICFCFVSTSIVFYFNKQTVIESENRYVTQFPDLPQKFSTSKLKHFFSELSQFYNDNFPFREEIIQKTSQLLPESAADNRQNAFRGKDNWIFLGNKFDRTIDKLTGKIHYSNAHDNMFSTNKRYSFYHAIAQTILKNNSNLVFLIAPNKATVYSEYLPKNIVPSEKPFHFELTKKMEENGLEVYYPLRELHEAKQNGILYFKNDTHWNQLGAFTVFIGIIRKYFPEEIPSVSQEDFTFHIEPSHPGDLNNIGKFLFNNEKNNDNFKVLYKNKPLTAAVDPMEINTITCLKLTNNNALADKSIWLIGDSFSSLLLPYFHHTFKTVFYTSRNRFTDSPQPVVPHADLVIYECVERDF